MIISALLGLIKSILYDLVLLSIGKILSNSRQLRRYLGLVKEDEQEKDFKLTAIWVENIGKLLMIIAILGILFSILTTSEVLYNSGLIR